MSSTAWAMQSFDDAKNRACQIAQEVVDADKLIIDSELFCKNITRFIKELPENIDNQEFLTRFQSFKKESHYRIKSFKNLLSYFIGDRCKEKYVCFPILLKLLPEYYLSKCMKNWLEFSFKSGKSIYFNFFLTKCSKYFDIKKLQNLYQKKPYRDPYSNIKNGYEQCKIFLNDYLSKQLAQEIILIVDSDDDYDSDSDTSDVDTDHKAAQALVQLSTGLFLIW